MRPQVVVVGPLAAANASALLSATALVTGSVALTSSTLDKARRIIFTSSGNDSTGLVYTINGTNWAGDPISETVSGVSAAAASTVLDYLSVTGVSSSGASAGTVSIGTNGTADSPWVRLDDWGPPTVAIQVTVFGTVTASVQQTLDDPNSPTSPVAPAAMTWINSADSAVVNFTTSQQSNYAFAPAFVRVLLSGGSGSITATINQVWHTGSMTGLTITPGLSTQLSLLGVSHGLTGGGGLTATAGTFSGLWAQAVVANGGTVSTARLALVTTLINAYITAGFWSLMDDALLLTAENVPQALTSLKQLRLATAVSSPTFTIDRGYAFNGSTQYIDTNFVPATNSMNNITLNGARIAVYERVNNAANATSAGTTSLAMRARNSGTTAGGAAQTTAAVNFATVSDSRGYSSVSRFGSTTMSFYKNGTLLTTNPGTAAGAVTAFSIYVGAANSSGSPTLFRVSTEGWADWGSGNVSATQELAVYTALQAFMTAIGANV